MLLHLATHPGKRLKVISNSKLKWLGQMATEVRKDEKRLHASDSYGEFSEEFIAEVLEAKREAEMGLGKRFDNVDDLIADLLDD